MARPLKNDAEKFTRRLPHIRCTEGEYAALLGKAAQAGLSLSEYVRQMAMNGKIIVRQSKVDFTLVDQLRRVGVNLNQQTRRMNLGGTVAPELRTLWEKLDKLLDQIIETV